MPRWRVLTELAASRNPYRVRAFEELAKHYEHRERNYAMALEMTRSAPRSKIRRRSAAAKSASRRGWQARVAAAAL